jgi:phosphomannomutase/phosphoglucomutase
MNSAGIIEVTIIGKDVSLPQYSYWVCSTPMTYYAALDTYDCTCIFTASHNPSEYVGIKIVDNKCLSIKSSDLREMFQKNEKDVIKWEALPRCIKYTDTRIETLLTDIKEKFQSLKKIPKITIDYSHGAATHFEQTFLRNILGDNAVHIFTNPDGNFPAHETDTSRFANYQSLIAEVKRNGSDFWFIFDGDADRFGMITKEWVVVTGDILLAIIGKQLLTDGTAEKLGSKTIFQEVFCGRIVGDTVKKYNGELRMTRVGRESFVREVIEANGLLAWEVSTHLLFKEYGTIEMPLAGLYYLLKTLENYESMTKKLDKLNLLVYCHPRS